MTKAVQRDRGQIGQLDQPRELVSHVGGVQRAAVRLGEEQVGIHPIRAEASLGFVLTGDVRDEDQDGVRVERNDPLRRRGLRLALTGLPAVLHDLVGHLDARGVQVGVGAALPTALAAAEAGVGDEVVERVERVVDDEVQELTGLFGRPHHHREGDLAGAPPLRDPFRGPQLRLRPHRRRQLDQLRHVVRQQPLVDVRPQDRAQGLLDPVQ
ncbi:hypothetical protein [Amycolatopsis sp. SID8362]|uniref:hypothetical protein n=1 Tax=Amycolatopsis sp. SID8362 TaxID=2690346 RepID=UPI0019443056|nr:hypothetical protein [Amycolatopsis sp. SID8362]